MNRFPVDQRITMNKKLLFYSQQGEDELVYEKYINRRRLDGIYLELGALDGIRYSNTKFFEDELGFSGVLIEPIPGQFRRLEQKHGKSNGTSVYFQHTLVEEGIDSSGLPISRRRQWKWNCLGNA